MRPRWIWSCDSAISTVKALSLMVILVLSKCMGDGADATAGGVEGVAGRVAGGEVVGVAAGVEEVSPEQAEGSARSRAASDMWEAARTVERELCMAQSFNMASS